MTWGGGTVQNLLELTVESEPSATVGWQGLSGAAVFVDGHIVGTLTELPHSFAGRRLTATPIEAVLGGCATMFAAPHNFQPSNLP